MASFFAELDDLDARVAELEASLESSATARQRAERAQKRANDAHKATHGEASKAADFKSDIYMFAAKCRISHTSYILLIIELFTYVYLSHPIAFRRRNVRYKVSPQVSPESLRTSLNNVKSRSDVKGGVKVVLPHIW